MKRNFYSNTTRNLYLSLIMLLTVAVGFTSCSKKADSITGTSYIKITNASETASPIDFYVDNTKQNPTPLQYNQSTGYLSVSSGNNRPASIKTAATGVNVVVFNISPQPGAYYSIFYFGGFTTAYQDDLTAPQSGKARVRFINLNLAITSDVDFGVTGGAKIVTNLAPTFNSDYFDVAPGATFSAYTAGTTTELLNIPTSIQAGHIYTIYMSGDAQTSLASNVLLQK